MRLHAFVLALTIICVGCTPTEVTIVPPRVPQGGRAVSIAVAQSDAKRIVVATESGGLFQTYNGGTSFQHLDAFPTFAGGNLMAAIRPPRPYAPIPHCPRATPSDPHRARRRRHGAAARCARDPPVPLGGPAERGRARAAAVARGHAGREPHGRLQPRAHPCLLLAAVRPRAASRRPAGRPACSGSACP